MERIYPVWSLTVIMATDSVGPYCICFMYLNEILFLIIQKGLLTCQTEGMFRFKGFTVL